VFFTNLLIAFFKKSIQHGILPEEFNYSIIKPLIKDVKKNHTGQNNIRPISVSGTLCTIFEKLLLHEVNKIHTDNKKQFGFKKNSRCQHSMFVLNEALNSNKRKN